MKKLKLNLSNLPEAEILTREHLKKVIGGKYAGEKKCVGKCWTGDRIGTSYDCGKYLLVDCGCRIDAVGSDCKIE